MKLHIAGPMRGYPEHNFPAFFAAEAQLQAAGYETLNPARHGSSYGLRQHFLWDIEDVKEADGIALLHNWGESQGANCEVALAGMLEIPVQMMEQWRDNKHIHLRPQKKQRIVAFTGYKGSGKDTAAPMLRDLCESQGMTTARRGFADALKDELADMLWRWVGARPTEIRAEMDDPAKKERYRLDLQWWGTEIRRAEDPEYWIKRMRDWIGQCKADVITVTDVRFENEAELVRELGGIVVRVERDGPRKDDHISETGIAKLWSSVCLANYGTLEMLQEAVTKLRSVLWVEKKPECLLHGCPYTQCSCKPPPEEVEAPNHYAPPVLGSEREYAEMYGLCPPSVKSEPAPTYVGPVAARLPHPVLDRCKDCGEWLEDCKCA